MTTANCLNRKISPGLPLRSSHGTLRRATFYSAIPPYGRPIGGTLALDHAASPDQPAPSQGAVTASPGAPRPVAPTLLRWLTIGVAGIALFPVIYTIDGAARPGYSLMRDAISTLSTGQAAWVQRLDFALCGVSVLWSAFVFRKILADGACATWYPIARVIEGAGLVAIAFFTKDPVHTIFLIVIVNAMCLGLFIIARRFWRNPAWRSWTAFSVACGLLPMVVMPFFGIGLKTHSVFSPYSGLLERVATEADTIWSIALVSRLWRRRSLTF